MEPFEPRLILVPTDFSETAAHALRYASALGQRFHAHLLVIYADSFMPAVDFAAGVAGAFELARDAMVDKAREDLQDHAEQNIDAAVPFDLRVIVNAPVDAINAQILESGADLVVMGTRGRTGLTRLMFGSVTESVMRIATVPVLAVNSFANETGRVGKVLCPVSFTPACRDALRHAAALVNGRTAPLVLLRHVDSRDAHMGMQDLTRMQQWVPRELVDRCEMKLMPAPDDAEHIVRIARASGVDLIALGVQAGRSVSETLRGTISERILQMSGCPVLTVNPFAAAALPAAAMDRERVAVSRLTME